MREHGLRHYHKYKDQINLKRRGNRVEENTKRKETNLQRKLQFIEYKGGCCNICKGEFHPAVYDFHHLNPKEKDKNIAWLRSHKLETVMKELDKCILVCANCHRKLHHENYQ